MITHTEWKIFVEAAIAGSTFIVFIDYICPYNKSENNENIKIQCLSFIVPMSTAG